jgi:hypothetical protein
MASPLQRAGSPRTRRFFPAQLGDAEPFVDPADRSRELLVCHPW